MKKQSLAAERRLLKKSLAGCREFGAASLDEAAGLLKITARQVRKLINSGALVSIMVRGERMIPRSEIRHHRER